VNMAISLVLLSIGFAVGSRWGLTGLAASWLIVYPIVFVIITSRALPTIGLTWPELLRRWRGALLAAVAMSAVVWGVQVAAAEFAPAARLVTAIGAGAAAYIMTIAAVERSAITELRALLAR
jgi:hypothetical protein